jgi:hypothetical protein
VIDFGLALRAESAPSTRKQSLDRTLLGSSIAGTLEYAAPEQLGKLKGVAVGPYSDVYGFGKTCCFALFGTAQPTFQHWQQIPRDLADLLGRCLSEQPRGRPQDFAAVLADLDRVMRPRPAPAPRELPEVIPVPAAVPVLQAVEVEPPRSRPPRRTEPARPKSRPRAEQRQEFEDRPAPRRRGAGGGVIVFFVALLLVFGGVGAFVYLFNSTGGVRFPDGPPRPIGFTRGLVPEEKFEPIAAQEFPAVYEELTRGKVESTRLRQVAGRLGETHPTREQAKSHELRKQLVKLSDSVKVSQAKLDAAQRDDQIWNVSCALEPLAKQQDLASWKAVTRAWEKWGTKENVPSLIKLTLAGGYGADVVRMSACKTLARLRDPRGIEAIAKRLESGWGPEAKVVTELLVEIGPAAEDDVLEQLKARDVGTRERAVAVLKEIGTQKSIKPLEAQVDSFVGHSARNAAQAIQARCAAGGKK